MLVLIMCQPIMSVSFFVSKVLLADFIVHLSLTERRRHSIWSWGQIPGKHTASAFTCSWCAAECWEVSCYHNDEHGWPLRALPLEGWECWRQSSTWSGKWKTVQSFITDNRLMTQRNVNFTWRYRTAMCLLSLSLFFRWFFSRTGLDNISIQFWPTTSWFREFYPFTGDQNRTCLMKTATEAFKINTLLQRALSF